MLPVSLIASLFVEAPQQRWTELELKAAMHRRLTALKATGAHEYIPRHDEAYAFDVGLRMLVQRRLVLEADGLLAMAPGEQEVVAYYANAIEHLLAPRARPVVSRLPTAPAVPP